MQRLPIVVLLTNVRSLYNVGSILRTADAVGAEAVICCGITPYPRQKNDQRPVFEARRTTAAIAKTALGAELTVPSHHFDDPTTAIEHYRGLGYQIVALEQSPQATNVFDFAPKAPLVVTLGHEVDGHSDGLLSQVDHIIEIPMVGSKESLNVSVAAGVALYQLRQSLIGR